MNLVRAYMSPNPLSVQPDELVGVVHAAMRDRRVHHVCVCSELALVGVISDRDISRCLPPPTAEYEERYSQVLTTKTAGEIMTPNPSVIDPNASIEDAARIFLAQPINSLPVVEDGELIGIVTPRDCLRAFCGG